MTSDNEFLAAALGYAALGWRVVPLHQAVAGGGCTCRRVDCDRVAKHPRTMNGLTDGTTDETTIRGWWAKWPAANVGVVCGRESNVWMVGPDGDAGIADFERLQAEQAEIVTPAAVSKSQGGGRHLLFSFPADGLPITNRKNHRGTKIDVRAEGGGPGYLVAPPSIGPKGRYEWIVPPPPAGLTPAPNWLVEWARGGVEKPKAESRASAPPPPRPGPADPAAHLHGRIVAYLARCPASVSGQRGHDDLFRAARALVVGFCLSDGDALSYLHNHFNPRCQPAWPQKDLEHKVKDAREKPFGKPFGYLRDASNPVMAHPPEREAVKPGEATPAGGKPAAGVTAADLIRMEFPPLKFALDGLLVEGLTILAGRPKKGKSWLSLMIGWAVAGGHTLDGRATTQGEVLYLALEDTARRLQRRLQKLRGGVDPWPVPAALHLHTSWPRGGDGLQALGERLAEAAGAVRLVIVDTLAKFRPPATGQASGYADDYEAVAGIKALADAYGASVLLVHHTRKMKAEDPFDEVSGTLGLSGAADGIWVLDSGEGKTADLFVTGRDVSEATIPLTFDPAFARWRLGDTIDGVAKGGRTAPEKAPSKVEQCKAWLREFLGQYACRGKDLDKAAKANGFSFQALRDAKAALGKNGSGEVTHHPFDGEWWSGLGPVSGWRYRPGGERPPGVPPETSESPESSPGARRRKTSERGSPGDSGELDDEKSQVF